MTVELITFITLVLTLVSSVVAIVTLGFVSFQTFYTKKALDAAKSSIELAKTSRQLEQLPDMHLIIQVTYFLDKWNDELEATVKYIREKNTGEILKISKAAPIDAAGLIDKTLYDFLPPWLSLIYATGAQYYYNSSCLYQYLNSEKTKTIDAEEYEERFMDSSNAIGVLLQYVKDEVPQVFLQCPASLNTNAFFSKNRIPPVPHKPLPGKGSGKAPAHPRLQRG